MPPAASKKAQPQNKQPAAAPTTSAKPNGAQPKAKPQKSDQELPESTTAAEGDAAAAAKPAHVGKPDQAAYQAEQEKIKAEIDGIQTKLNAVKEKISLTTKDGPGAERRAALRAEQDTLRSQQSGTKASRGKILDQLKAINDNVAKKVKDLQAAKAKAPYKTVAEVDAAIKNLDKQVESGTMAIAQEKRALAEISTLKRSRRTIEAFQADQDSIESERARADELRKQLDDPESKAMHERYDAIKAELDELKKESDEAYAGRSKLFDERTELQKQLTVLHEKKRESAQQYREANDRYWQKVQEERARRAEKYRAQRAAEEEAKRGEVIERLREEAAVPAFQSQIEDCQTLIDFFAKIHSGGSADAAPPPTLSTTKAEVAGVPKLEIRKVEEKLDKNLVVLKKKNEDEEVFFVGNKGKGKKGGASASAANGKAASKTGTDQLNIPLGTLTALLQLSIPPPSSISELPRAIDDLRTKKAWFDANQKRVTEENIAKAEEKIRALESKGQTGNGHEHDNASPQPSDAISAPEAAESGGANGDAVAAES